MGRSLCKEKPLLFFTGIWKLIYSFIYSTFSSGGLRAKGAIESCCVREIKRSQLEFAFEEGKAMKLLGALPVVSLV